MLADDSPSLSMYLNLYDLGHDEYVEYCEKLTLAITYLIYFTNIRKKFGITKLFSLLLHFICVMINQQ